MSLNDTFSSTLTRRSFLKTSLVGAAVGAGAMTGLTGCSPKSESDTGDLLADTSSGNSIPEEVHCGVCRGNCCQQCFLNFHVRDGKVARTSMRPFIDERFNRICMKGLSMPEKIYSDHRVKYPMRRVGERGAGDWERISWDEAIQTIADTWRQCTEEFGPNSVAWVTRTGQHGTAFRVAYSRLVTMLGGVTMNVAADMEFSQGLIDTIGVPAANDQTDMVNARTFLFQGSSFTESTYHHWHFVREAQKQGCKIIVVDPVYTGIASKADLWLPIRPATDAVLFMAMINIAIENEWIDWDFMRDHTVAPFLVKEDGTFLRMKEIGGADDDEDFVAVDAATGTPGRAGEVADPALRGSHVVEGIAVASPWDLLLESIREYTPARAAEICDVPEEDIRTATEWFCTNGPSSLKIGLGPDHRHNASGHYHASCAFAIVTGMLGKSGCCTGYISGTYPYESEGIAIAEGAEPLAPTTPIAPSQFVSVMETGKYGDLDIPLKMLVNYGNDFVRGRGDREKTLAALDKLELLVSINLEMNDTSLLADIVLPVCEWCEYEEINGAATYYPFITYQEPVVAPAFESKSDFDIVKLLFGAIGHGDWFDWELPDLFARYYGQELYDRIKAEKCVYHQYWEEAGHRFIYGEDGVWTTSTGKLQFYTEAPMPFTYSPYGRERDTAWLRLPGFKTPGEAWNEDVPGFPKNPLSDKYPLIMQETHAKWHSQSNFLRIGILQELNPEPVVRMSAKDAADRGIADGDYVRVFNDRGSVVLKAVVNYGARPGMVDMPNGWTADQFVEEHYCDLQTAATDDNVENSSFSDSLVQIEKYDGEVTK